jgi:hypothetical protein
MRSRRQYRDRIARQAAHKLAWCAVIILGFTCVMMQLTVWNRPAAQDREPFYTTLPGVDLNGVPPAKLPALLKELNTRRCTCECMRTLASCRNHHRSCSFSAPVAMEAVAAAREH